MEPRTKFDQVFAAAYIDNGNSHRILGVKVRPFCLWHLMLMQVVDSAFLKSGEVSRYDLRVAIGICRLRYRQSRVHKPLLPVVTRKQFRKTIKQFLEYVGDYLSKPEYNIIPFEVPGGSHGKPRHMPSPPPDLVVVAYDAAHGARVTIQEAWDMPIGEAYIAQSMFLRNQGLQVDYMNEEERMFQLAMKEAENAKRAK